MYNKHPRGIIFRTRVIWYFCFDIGAIHSMGIQSASFPEFVLDEVIVLTKLSPWGTAEGWPDDKRTENKRERIAFTEL